MAPPFHRTKEKGRLELCEVWGKNLGFLTFWPWESWRHIRKA